MIIKNKILPFGPYEAMAIWPFIFTKVDLDQKTLNHEKIHHAQQKEMLLVFFYLAYALFFVWNLIRMNSSPYRNIPFEREAYDNQHNLSYLDTRRPYRWTKYL